MNPLQLISKYRSSLMGIAILWIILHHVLPLAGFSDIYFIGFLSKIGYAGVDVFLFLSGFGLYYSSLKHETIGQYYLRRFIRIYPVYIIVLIVNNILHGGSLFTFFTELFALDLWIGTSSPFWYVSSIVIFYLIFPFYIILFKKKPYLSTLAMIILGFILSNLSMNYGIGNWLTIFFLSRIPIFFVGILFGKLSLEKDLDYKVKIVLYLLMIVGCAIFYVIQSRFHSSRFFWWGLWYPFILIIPGLCLLISEIFNKYLKQIAQNILVFFGKISFELYIVHATILGYFDFNFYSDKLKLNTGILVTIALIVSVTISYLLHKLADRISAFVTKKTVTN